MPFKCEFCKDIYCADHRRPNDHKCRNANGEEDDNYVILCPICKTGLSLKGLASQGITPAHLWNEHVETGECQLKLNQKAAKLDADGRSTHCQAAKCKTKITDINHFKCPHCAMDLCMPHRYEDEHACKPVKQSDQYEKIKKSSKLFNWSSESKAKKKESSGGPELSFGDKVLRFLVCCGTQPKKDKNDKSKQANRRAPEP